jgi:hypothetical protein
MPNSGAAPLSLNSASSPVAEYPTEGRLQGNPSGFAPLGLAAPRSVGVGAPCDEAKFRLKGARAMKLAEPNPVDPTAKTIELLFSPYSTSEMIYAFSWELVEPEGYYAGYIDPLEEERERIWNCLQGWLGPRRLPDGEWYWIHPIEHTVFILDGLDFSMHLFADSASLEQGLASLQQGWYRFVEHAVRVRWNKD